MNSVMTNSESWHNVHIKHVKSLEKMDLDLLRKILNAHAKTPSETVFLELGKYPLRFVLAKRRLMFLWHILHRETDELIWKIYETQKLKSSKGDWFVMIQEERQKHGILETDQQISIMSREKLKKIVEAKLKTSAVKHLTVFPEGHSKREKIRQEKFERKSYFSDRRFTKKRSYKAAKTR